MNWLDDYRSKVRTPAEAVGMITSGDRVYYAGNAAIPQTLVRALAARRDELHDVQLNHVLLIGEDPLSAPGMEGHFRHNSLFVGPADRKAVNDGRADYVPIFLHQIPRLFRERIVPLDVAMVQVSPPDEHGFMSLGVEVLASTAACQTARTVIAQVNEKMPRVLGDSFLHVGRVHAIVEATEPLPELHLDPATAVERAIASHVLGLITPGCTLQMGIGGIPDSVWESIEGAMELGIHTEMISDGAMRAIQRGVVSGIHKTLHPGKVILTFALGTAQLYDFLDNNPMIEAHPVNHVNDPEVAAQNDNLVAINSAIEVDLTGGVLGFDRSVHLLRLRRAGGLHPRRSPLEGRPAGHRHSVDGQGRGDVADRAVSQGGGRCCHQPGGRALCRDRARAGEPVRQEPPGAGRIARQHRASRLSGRPGAGSQGAQAAAVITAASGRATTWRGCEADPGDGGTWADRIGAGSGAAGTVRSGSCGGVGHPRRAGRGGE
jgi:4-hydroxybutyrate CoA-transferase